MLCVTINEKICKSEGGSPKLPGNKGNYLSNSESSRVEVDKIKYRTTTNVYK